MSDRSPLRQALDTAIEDAKINGGKLSLNDLTVMSEGKDPFRLDTPANHALGKWLADTMARTVGGRKIHNRGLHYAILGQPKPDGSQYVNDDDHWEWLYKQAVKSARWLGYIPFDQITDERNDEPIVRIFQEPNPWPYLNAEIDVKIPEADEIKPTLGVGDFVGVQPYKLVLIGEKSSLDAELAPIADRYMADLYLPTGDISDTLVYNLARIGADDGRPMVVIYFADCDPAGWNMGIVIARKLQAFKILHFPDLEFQVHRAGLTPAQVREFELPSTPLKAKEARADKWRAAMGVEQTEIDALATLQPELLRQIAREAIAPFYDAGLDRRVAEAKREWLAAAKRVINDQLDGEQLARIRAEAAEKLAAMQEQIDAINDQLRINVDDFDLPGIEIPDPDPTLGVDAPEPLIHSWWSFAEQTDSLKASKRYELGGGAA